MIHPPIIFNTQIHFAHHESDSIGFFAREAIHRVMLSHFNVQFVWQLEMQLHTEFHEVVIQKHKRHPYMKANSLLA